MARLTLLSALLTYFCSLQPPPKQDRKTVKFSVATAFKWVQQVGSKQKLSGAPVWYQRQKDWKEFLMRPFFLIPNVHAVIGSEVPEKEAFFYFCASGYVSNQASSNNTQQAHKSLQDIGIFPSVFKQRGAKSSPELHFSSKSKLFFTNVISDKTCSSLMFHDRQQNLHTRVGYQLEASSTAACTASLFPPWMGMTIGETQVFNAQFLYSLFTFLEESRMFCD